MTFDLFAFNAHQDSSHDLRRSGIPEWRIGEAVQWAAAKGVDTIMLQATGAAPSSTREKTHHLCRDPRCPGGCE